MSSLFQEVWPDILVEAEEAAHAARALLVHVSNCDGLAILSERLSQEQLEELGGKFSKARKAGVPLLEWAEKIRKRPS
ncbi:MAG: hypothetical protein ACLFVG_03885 [Candidatus Aminicenantes bacterium]